MSSTTTATVALPDGALPDGALQVALSADLARTDASDTLRELAQPVHRVPGAATMASVDALFRRDATLRWVVVAVLLIRAGPLGSPAMVTPMSVPTIAVRDDALSPVRVDLDRRSSARDGPASGIMGAWRHPRRQS